jgi:hypothetical membrane protein
MARKLIWLGVSAPIVFITMAALASAVTPGYSNLDNALSELGMRTAPHAAAWNVLGFGLLGAQIVGFAAAFFAHTRARIVSLLLALTGVGFIGAGLVAAEPGFAPAAQTSVHLTMAALSYFPFIVAALIFGLTRLSNVEWRGLAVISLVAASLALATFVLPRTLPAGLVQRLGFAIYFAWLIAAAWWLGRQGAGQAIGSPEALRSPIRSL